MSTLEYREMSQEQLNEELLNLCKEQFNLTMQKATKQLVKPHLIKNVRRNIARVKTIKSEKAV